MPESFLATILIKLTGIHVIVTAAQVILYAYALRKLDRLGDIKYYPFMRFLNMILSMWVKILALEAVLSWSSKWPYMHKNIDPNYPGEETKENISVRKKHSTTS
jgi:hypothetical protein